MQNNRFFLPIESLSFNAIEYIEQIKELIDAVKGDCLTNDLSSHFTFIQEQGVIKNTAYIEKAKDNLFHIRISENFGQYIWSVGLYLSVYFDNKVQIPMMNMAGTNIDNYVANEKDLEFANEMFFNGRRLLDHFIKELYWNKPNIVFPEPYTEIIEKANGIYCGAITFIYAHEFSHNFLGHTHFENSYKYAIQDEMKADATAISFIQEEYETRFGFTYKIGIATVLSSILLMGEDSISGSGTHPDMDTRIENLMNELSLPEMDNLWGYMAIAMKMWLLLNNGITINEDIEHAAFTTYKNMYEYYLSKLKEVRRIRFPNIVCPEWNK
jgi:hypothetical protein